MIYKYDRFYDEHPFAKCHNGFFLQIEAKSITIPLKSDSMEINSVKK